MVSAVEITATAPDTATKAKPYVCLTCTRPFARLEHLKRHERSHTKEKPFCCDQAGTIPGCGRRFARRDLLLRHQQKIHLFPNTSKRRRLSSISQPSVKSPAEQKPAAREQFTISIPNLDDLTNLENGTVNPSSIYSTSPTGSSHSNTVAATQQQHQQQQQQFADTNLELIARPVSEQTQTFGYATERLFPVGLDVSSSHSTDMQQSLWPMPDLSIGVESPTSTVSSLYSPAATYGSLGRASSLEQAGSDSDLFSPDFFVSNGAFLRHLPHQRSASMPQAMPHLHNSHQSDLFLSNHLDQISQRMAKAGYTGDDLAFQFAGGDQAYCNGFRPAESVYGSVNYVESF